VPFNDTCCDSVAELRSVILKARRLAEDHTEQERAAAAVKAWLLAQIAKKRPAPSVAIEDTAPDERFVPEASPPSDRSQQRSIRASIKRPPVFQRGRTQL
jgi:hypothetical protein